jgi:hypothetical protein
MSKSIFMKVTLAMIFVCVSATAQNEAEVSGRWRVHGWLDGNALVAECVFSHRGTVLRGRCTSREGSSDITGYVKGSTIQWSYNMDANGNPSSISFTGAVVGERISGKIAMDPDSSSGRFTASIVR